MAIESNSRNASVTKKTKIARVQVADAIGYAYIYRR